MKNIRILDCTLRDGGRIIDCKFPEYNINEIIKGLSLSGIDLIEIGFLRGNVDYKGNSTFFTEMSQIDKHIPKNNEKTMYVLFIDYGLQYGMWDFKKLLKHNNGPIEGIRLGFRKEDFYESQEIMHLIQDKGYKLFVQAIESLNYSDKELLEVIETMNRIMPYSFGIVDTFGSMYKDDLLRIYTLVDHNLNPTIAIDIHSHNNMQLSFSFAQEIVELSRGTRAIIIDATLNGMGKGAGNLNTELIVDYLNRKHGYNYNLDKIFDVIDENIYWIKRDNDWGYSIPSFMSGIYSAHPNNVKYLTQMHKLRTKDIKNILSMIKPELRKRYDYDNIDHLYLEYFGSDFDDTENLKMLQSVFKNKRILLVVFGATLKNYEEKIEQFIENEKPIVISINHIYDKLPLDYVFYGNQRRYHHDLNIENKAMCIITSNFDSERKTDIVVNYNKLLSLGYKNFDNTTIMCLNLLKNLGKEKIVIAGLDGYSKDIAVTYFDEKYSHYSNLKEYESININLEELLKNFANKLKSRTNINFITPSRFEYIFK